ncbi:MAG: glycosyltransferase family 39 protein [Candidatus Omnitrophica bacterium]|nr:glycosyltransferase family 39 protein [Candidatus Omnitrophota bacterium]
MSNKLKIFSDFLWSKRKKILVLSIIALLGFLHFRNLSDAVFIQPDEARPFALLRTGPFLYLLCSPLYKIFHTQSSIFYFAAFLGFANIFLYYYIIRRMTNPVVALYSACFYAFLPFRFNYVRFLYPAVFIEFFVLVLAIVLHRVLIEKEKYWIIGCGLLTAVLLYIHPFIYALILSMLVSLIIFGWPQLKRRPKSYFLGLALWYLLSFLAGYLVLEKILLYINPGYSFTEKLFIFHDRVIEGIVKDGNTLSLFFRIMWQFIVLSWCSVIRNSLLIISWLAGLFFIFKKREPNLLFIVSFGFLGIGFFFLFSFFKMHEVYDRHLIWTGLVLSFLSGYSLYSFLGFSQKTKKIVMIVFSFLIILMAFKNYQITVETFKNDQIKAWFKQRNIPKKRVLTFLNLYSLGDKDGRSFPPVFFKDDRYHILWPLILNAYRKGLFDYIIPSGLGLYAELAEDDIFLKNVSPLSSWEHPYTEFKHRFYLLRDKNEKKIYINIYRLADVFSESNYYAIHAETDSE